MRESAENTADQTTLNAYTKELLTHLRGDEHNSADDLGCGFVTFQDYIIGAYNSDMPPTRATLEHCLAGFGFEIVRTQKSLF